MFNHNMYAYSLYYINISTRIYKTQYYTYNMMINNLSKQQKMYTIYGVND